MAIGWIEFEPIIRVYALNNKNMVNEGILNLPINDGSCNIYHIDLDQFDGIFSDMERTPKYIKSFGAK